MPFADFKDWDDCISKMKRYYRADVAEKVCGKLKAKYEKQESVNPQTEENADESNEAGEVDKDQWGSVGFGGMIDANFQVKGGQHPTGELPKKKKPPVVQQYGNDVSPGEQHGQVG
jgi:hypothetical protein